MRADTWITRAQGSTRRALTAYVLRCTRGANAGQTKRVETARFTLGALEGNAWVLDDQSVSGLHAELSHDERGVRVRDLGSRNGTFVDGVRVNDAFLTRPATLTLGATELAFEPQSDSVVQESTEATQFGPLLGHGAVMRELFAKLARFAASDASVLIHGETGTGKELVAEALVQAGPRAQKPVVVVDCGALAPTLIESELFGHEKGAFTGAVATKPGVFERAHGGTVFLDELGELPLELQPRLLRVLERREVQRVGGSGPIAVDVRVLAATHRELEREVNQGRFRADLYYRLSVLRVDVPALRERREDIAHLVKHFAAGHPVSERELQRLVEHDWPGNVRELRNAVERLKAGAEPLRASPAPTPATTHPVRLDEPYLVQKERLVGAFERDYATQLLEACKGNLAEGARLAGVSRMAVVKMLSRLGLGP